jgi:hypothetical protein
MTNSPIRRLISDLSEFIEESTNLVEIISPLLQEM